LIERNDLLPKPVIQLSEKGAELGEVLLAFVHWGKKHLPGTRTLKEFTEDSGRKESG
jgi:DNA-binding HxlR family transcriptional regulator